MNDPRNQLDILRDRIESGDREIETEADREALLEFSNQLELLSSEYTDHRHVKLLRHCTRMAENVGGLAASLEERDAAEAIVRWINRTYDNEETNRDYRSAIRVFGKRVTRSDEPPESIAWVPTGTSNSHDPAPRAADMLDWDDDVLPMIDAARNPRDEAMIAVQFEAGCRSGELRDLTIGDVFDSNHGVGLHVDGKTGERAVHLIISVPYLQRWLSDHPAPDDPSAPLWSKLGVAELPSYPVWANNLKLPAERAGIEKPVTPTNFRKSNTRWLVQQGLSQSAIEDRQGRERGSKHTARYLARFGEESSERRYAEAHGKDVETEADVDRTPVECPRCGTETPREREFCMACNQALDVEAQELIDRIKSRLDDELVEADDAETREDLIDARQTVDAKPGMLDKGELHELVTSLSED